MAAQSLNTILNIDNANRRKTKDEKMNTEVSHKLHGDGEGDLRGNHLPQESVFQPACSTPDVELSAVNTVETISGSTTSSSALLRPSISAPYQKYPCLPLTVGSAWREQKILERLQVLTTYLLNLHCSLF